jgi:hypothetical protein
VPHSCMNPKQKAAIERARERFDLPLPTVPPVPKELASEARRQEILGELRESQAPLLVLLGDQPIKWFLRHFDSRWKRLSDFPCYGQRHNVKLDGVEVDVLPLVHPRQIGRLGAHSEVWARKHEEWILRQGRICLPSTWKVHLRFGTGVVFPRAASCMPYSLPYSAKRLPRQVNQAGSVFVGLLAPQR